jgi:hypothetical protein
VEAKCNYYGKRIGSEKIYSRVFFIFYSILSRYLKIDFQFYGLLVVLVDNLWIICFVDFFGAFKQFAWLFRWFWLLTLMLELFGGQEIYSGFVVGIYFFFNFLILFLNYFLEHLLHSMKNLDMSCRHATQKTLPIHHLRALIWHTKGIPIQTLKPKTITENMKYSSYFIHQL